MKAILPISQYEAYEAVILSGQVDRNFVPGLLASDPEFARWYSSRAQARANVQMREAMEAAHTPALESLRPCSAKRAAALCKVARWITALRTPCGSTRYDDTYSSAYRSSFRHDNCVQG